MSGFYVMHRGWQEHPALAGREPYDRRSAWVWLVEHALFEARQVRIAGKFVEMGRGQLSYSLRFLAKTWSWGHERVRRFLAVLRDCGEIETAGETGQIVVTICNYDDFQAPQKPARQPSRQRRDSVETNNKEGEIIRRKESPPTPQGAEIEADFGKFYEAYPRHTAPQAALQKYRAARKTADADTLLAAARRYAELCESKERQYIAHPATWLHQGRWEDEDVKPRLVVDNARSVPPGPCPVEEVLALIRSKG